MTYHPSNDWGERVVLHEATERQMDLTHVHGSRFLHLNFQLTRHHEMLIDRRTARELMHALECFLAHGHLPKGDKPMIDARAFI